ncbi:MAG: hypothetical protein JWL58_6292 [Streptosporangiaceae bacterium]|nr:hypothetical protein [Streptosporangiaceae bacterium]
MTTASEEHGTIQRRFGLERLPTLTVIVFAVTAVPNALQFAVHGMLERRWSPCATSTVPRCWPA